MISTIRRYKKPCSCYKRTFLKRELNPHFQLSHHQFKWYLWKRSVLNMRVSITRVSPIIRTQPALLSRAVLTYPARLILELSTDASHINVTKLVITRDRSTLTLGYLRTVQWLSEESSIAITRGWRGLFFLIKKYTRKVYLQTKFDVY